MPIVGAPCPLPLRGLYRDCCSAWGGSLELPARLAHLSETAKVATIQRRLVSINAAHKLAHTLAHRQ